ncbi:MAG: inositol monophosphatase family protein [bacterium]|nr:inositol monophosphatase family protein [bacterium]
MENTSKFLEVGILAARQAGDFLMSKYGSVKNVASKERTDIVTEADLGSEEIILKILKENFPDHNIFSEEVGRLDNKNSKYQWIVDPLDATVNYASGLPLFSVSIGLVKNNTPIVGVVFAPYLSEMFFATVGKGAFLNDSAILVSKNNELNNSVINIGLSAHYNDEQIQKTWKICNNITAKLRGIRAFESGALTSCYVACGRLDGKISVKTDPFGNAASTIIIQEAKGRVSDFSDKNWSVDMKDMICSNNLIHEKVFNYL